VVVEDVAGEGLASGGTAEQEGDLPVGHGLFGEIVIDDQGVLAPIPEIFADTATGKGGDVLQGGRVAGAGRNDAGIRHGIVFAEILHHLGHGGFLLADGDIDTFNARFLLADDGIDTDGGLADLAVADDQLALSPADGRHGVDSLQTGVHGLIDRLALNNAGSDHFDTAELRGFNRPFTVDGSTGTVDNAPHNGFADGYLGDPTGSLDDVAFFDVGDLTENGNADIVPFQVENHAEDAAWELQEFHGHGVLDAVDPGDAVTDGQHRSGLTDVQLLLVVLDLFGYDLTYFFCPDCIHALHLLP